MSRIGKAPIPEPAGVTVKVDGGHVSVKGPKGQLELTLRPEVSVKQEDGKLLVQRISEDRMVRSLHGLSRTLVANMVKGVTEGFSKTLEIVGVGYRATMDGRKLVLALGYSHPVEITPPEGIEIAVGKGNVITVTGYDKQMLGDVCAD